MTVRKTTPRQDQGGYTLLSVLLAVFILSIGLVALARTQSGLMASHQNTENRDVATSVASSYMEDLRGRVPSTLVTEPPVKVDARGAADPNGAYTRTTTVTMDNPSLLRVLVSVSYPRMNQPVNLTTLIYRP